MTQIDSNGVTVMQIQEGSSAAEAGVKPGDYLLTVGDVPVQDQQFGARLRAKYGASVEGSPLPIKVRRGGETLTLPGKLRFGPGDIMVEPDPGAGAKAIRIRNGILKGTTG
jgi:S1-C subfamily serine protease